MQRELKIQIIFNSDKHVDETRQWYKAVFWIKIKGSLFALRFFKKNVYEYGIIYEKKK